MKLYLDTETVGLMGPVKLIQYSVDRGPVCFIGLSQDWQYKAALHVYGGVPYHAVIRSKLEDLFAMMDDPNTTVVTFNGGFDLFKLYQLRHSLHFKPGSHQSLPQTSHERPVKAFRSRHLDLYTHAVRTGPFAPWAFTKKTGRRVVKLNRVPAVAKELVAETVEREIRKKLPEGVKIKRSEHRVPKRSDLVTLSWITIASNTLKAIAEHYTGTPPIKLKDVWPLPDWKEETWLPYWEHDPRYAALEAECDKIIAGSDPRSELFFEYAHRDITHLWAVEDGLGRPNPDHHDASVECVAYTRYFGFDIDQEALGRTLAHYEKQVSECETLLSGVNLRSSKQRLARLKQELPFIGNSSKVTLKEIVKSYADEPVGKVASAMLGYGAAKQRLDQARKLAGCLTGRAHPELRVMGTATNRMAGAAGFNYQGIAQVEKIDGKLIGLRSAIKTSFGGDFKTFEIAIAASAWNDRQMLSDLDNGVDIHTAVMVDAHPDAKGKVDYETAVIAKEDKSHPMFPLVKRCRDEIKRIVFGILYGAAAPKINEVLGFTPEDPRGQQVLDGFFARYKEAGAFRKSEEKRFLTADTERWTSSSVSKMARSAGNLTGSARHFDFECDVADILWRVGRNFSKYVDQSQIPTGIIERSGHKGQQTIKGAVQSAFLGGALMIQQSIFRAGVNTVIQAGGANLCKMLMANLWRKTFCPVLNVHDELVAPEHPCFNYQTFEEIVGEFVATWKGKVKHIGLDYKETARWSEK